MPQISLHPTQSEIYRDLFIDLKCRFAVAVCSRGWGKSHEAATVAMTAVFELMELDASVPNKNVAIVAPTFDQVRDIYQPLLSNQFGISDFVESEKESLGRYYFPNNVELHLLSYEAVERMRGKGYYLVVIDEPSSMRNLKENWENVIYPTITSRWSWMHADLYGARSAGRALFAGTPKGFNFLEEVSNYREIDNEWMTYIHDYTASPLLDPREVEKAKQKMDPIRFASEYLALFKESGASLFYMFDRQIHVQNIIPPEPEETIHCAIDFNVMRMATSFFVVRGGQMQFFAEKQGSPDTPELAAYINAKFKNDIRRIIAYPDPSGNARKSSAVVGQTDFSLLRQAGITVMARSQVPIVDSTNAVNSMLKNANGKTNMFFDPIGCPDTIKSVERTKWVEGNSDLALIDKTENAEHFSDGVRYATDYLFPVRSSVVGSAKGSTF
jgi:hypothetical protein